MAICLDFSSVDATTAMTAAWFCLFCFLLYAVLRSPVLLELVRRRPPAPPASPPAPVDIYSGKFASWTCPCHARVPPGSSSSTTTNTATTNDQGVSDQKDKLA